MPNFTTFTSNFNSTKLYSLQSQNCMRWLKLEQIILPCKSNVSREKKKSIEQRNKQSAFCQKYLLNYIFKKWKPAVKTLFSAKFLRAEEAFSCRTYDPSPPAGHCCRLG